MKLRDIDAFLLVMIVFFLGFPVYMILIQHHNHESK